MYSANLHTNIPQSEPFICCGISFAIALVQLDPIHELLNTLNKYENSLSIYYPFLDVMLFLHVGEQRLKATMVSTPHAVIICYTLPLHVNGR